MEKRTYSSSMRTKRRIYDVAMRLFTQNGYSKTSLKEVAAAAEVSMGTIYRYFPSKGDFMAEIGFESVSHLKEYAEALPRDMPLLERIVSVLMEDVRGNMELFFRPVTVDGKTEYRPNDLRAAYYSAFATNKEHFDSEIASRDILAGIYEGILDDAVASGELLCADTDSLAQTITAVFFQVDERSSFTVGYPYEQVFRRRISCLLEGKLAGEGRVR